MAKNLPYFKFFSAEWLTGDIVYEDFETQGLFINICATYWHRDGVLSMKDIEKRYKSERLANLTERFIWVNSDGFISIKFLDEQLSERGYVSQVNSKNGKKGGRPKFQHTDIEGEKPTAFNSVSEMKANESNKEEELESDKELELDQELKNEVAKIPPEFRYVEEYFNIKGELQQAQRFYDYYTSNGWRVGKNKMKCWKSAVRNWLSNKKEFKNNGSITETEPKFGRIPISELRDYASNPAPLRFERDNPLK